ncbi:MAG: hypothetical protein ACYCOU_01295 [Sulfobacillus sp.]
MLLKRYRKVLTQIKAHPETWNQLYWHLATDCGASHCFAGWAQVLAMRLDPDRVPYGVKEHASVTATRWLGLTESEADYLFDPGRALADFEAVAQYGCIPAPSIYE